MRRARRLASHPASAPAIVQLIISRLLTDIQVLYTEENTKTAERQNAKNLKNVKKPLTFSAIHASWRFQYPFSIHSGQTHTPIVKEKSFLGLSQSGFHRIAYTEWGDERNPRVLICVHGLTRNGRDFDLLAASLSRHYRVICPDIAGRGKSDWLANKADYNYPQYLADMNALIARSEAESVDWLGTSMGGLMGMLLAAMPGSPIGKLVINDAGFVLAREALERIGEYVGDDTRFDTYEEFRNYIRAISEPFALKTDAQWDLVARHMASFDENGKVHCNYDPGIAQTFITAATSDVDLSAYWKAVACPVLVVRGALSDLLPRTVYREMLGKPGVKGVEIPGVGHAPMFMDEAQISVVHDFLLTR
jgi:pimeloyl-ACP methyl ester carboxylesterase